MKMKKDKKETNKINDKININETNQDYEEKSKKNKKEKSKKKSCEEKIKELEEKVKELENEKLRALADFENFRKRKETELFEARERAIINFVVDLLPSIDNFETSLKMTDNKEMFVKGVEMIHKNLLDTLKNYKIEKFNVEKGETFNPEKHDPILIDDEKSEKGKVLEVLKHGYAHKNRVIRPAKVKIKKE